MINFVVTMNNTGQEHTSNGNMEMLRSGSFLISCIPIQLSIRVKYCTVSWGVDMRTVNGTVQYCILYYTVQKNKNVVMPAFNDV